MNKPGPVSDPPSGAILWRHRPVSSKGPAPSLTISRIAAVAVDIADGAGVESVSMARVAAAFGLSKMALYRYLTTKSELVAIMIEDAVEQAPDLTGVPGGWRARLEELLAHLAGVWQRHPWLPHVTVGERPMGPRELSWTDAAVAALEDTGLDGGERLAVAFVLFGHLRNTQSLRTAGSQAWTESPHLGPAGTWPAEAAERLPALTEALASPTAALVDRGRTLGLTILLDGLEQHIGRRAARDGAGLVPGPG